MAKADRRMARIADLMCIVVLLCIAAIIFYLFAVRPASGHEDLRGMHGHHHGRLHSWYQTLMRPDMPSVSCCSSTDCTPTRAERRGDAWWAMRNGEWVEIPASKINREDSIDTQAHICFPASYEGIFCFVKPGSAI